MSALPPGDSLAELRDALTADPEGLARDLLGEPNRGGSKSEWRWGRQGSKSLALRGPDRGSYYDHEAGEGGGLLHMVKLVRGGTWAETIAWAKAWAGLDGTVPQDRPRRPLPDPAVIVAREAEEAAAKARRIAKGQGFWHRRQPIAGTVAEAYLASRAIPAPAGGWPDCIAFLPGEHHGLIACVTDAAGEVRAVQVVHLDPAGRKVWQRPADWPEKQKWSPKQSFGVVGGDAVRLPGNATGPLLLGEGLETVLSAWLATGAEAWAVLGGVRKAAPPPNRQLLILADDDAPGSRADNERNKAIAAWRAAGHDVRVAYPWPERRGDGSDFNDLAQADRDAVRARIEAALAVPAAPPEPRRPVVPYHPLPTATADEARELVRHHVHRFNARTLDWHAAPPDERGDPERAGIASEVGTGKTSITVEELAGDIAAQAAGFIAQAKARELPHRVLIATSTHALGNEIVAKLRGLGAHVAHARGRNADDPERPGAKMCLNLGEVEDALAALEDVEEAVCGRPGGPRCPFAGECGFQRQKARAAAADVVVTAHETVLGTLPGWIGSGFAMTIMDEGWLQDGRVEKTLDVATLEAGPGRHPVPRRDDPDRTDLDATDDLHRLRARMARARKASPDGYLSRAALIAEGLTAKDCEVAEALEWRRKVTGLLRPGLSDAAREEAKRRCSGNAAIPALAAMWRLTGELLAGDSDATGRIERATEDTREGTRRVLRLNYLQAVAKRVLELPLLLLDATMPVRLLSHRLPRLKLLADVRVAAPHMRVHQILGGFGKTTLIPHEKASKAANTTRLNRIAKLRDAIMLRTGGERALVISYADLEPHFAGLPGVETAHFNNIAGRDEWGPQPGRSGVRHLFIIGRPAARPEDVRRLVAALTGRAIAPEEPQLVPRGATMRDGSARSVDVRAYEDADLEAMRAAITDAEMLQAIGRARGINRTEDDPVDVWVFAGDVVLPVPVDDVCEWKDEVEPGALVRMVARGVVLCSPRDAHAAYGDLFTTVEAAKKARQRDGTTEHGDIPLWDSPIGVCPRVPLVRVSYRPALPNAKTRMAWAHRDRLPGLRAWLEGITGAELAHYEVANPPSTAPDPELPAAVPDCDPPMPVPDTSARMPVRMDRPVPAPRPQPDIAILASATAGHPTPAAPTGPP